MPKKTLLQKIASKKALQKAWDNLDKHNKSSHGLSGETIEIFSLNKDEKIAAITKKLIEKKYKFSPSRPVAIRKSDKASYRPLQIPEITDRIVIKAIAMELEDIFKNTLLKSKGYSFAYQKKTSIQDAISKIEEYYKKGYKYCLKADIIDFFNKVDKDALLINEIYPQLPEDSINDLIEQSLNIPLGGVDLLKPEQKTCFNNINTGIPQGNALSPLLSNIYLSPFDEHLISKGFNLVRYADDFIIACKSEKECLNAYSECIIALKKLGLSIHSLDQKGKTKIIDIDIDTLTFLSVTFDGIRKYPSKESFEKIKGKITDICNGKIQQSILSLLKKLINVLEGWISAYIFTDIDRYSEELDFYINKYLLISLKKYKWELLHQSVLPKKYQKERESVKCLSREQRKNSGIPFVQELINFKKNR